MHDDDIADRRYHNISLTQITVTDFIQQRFKSGDTTPIFAHVYEPINGTREVLVTVNHVPEALSLVKAQASNSVAI
jgi:hypothetical protein